MKQVRGIFKKVIELVKKPEMRILPGQLAFFFVMAFIPIITLVGVIASQFNISTEALQASLDIAMPSSVSNLIVRMISSEGFNFNIGVFLVSAVILASNGTHSIIIAANEIYKLEPKDFFSRRLKSISMILILIEVIFFILVIPVFGDTIFAILRAEAQNKNFIEFAYKIYRLLKYPVSLIIIYLNIKLIYTIAPDQTINSKTTTKGAIFTTVSWIVSAELYAYYLDNYTRYAVYYGGVSGLIILLLWIYMLAYIFVLGLSLNAADYNTMKKEE